MRFTLNKNKQRKKRIPSFFSVFIKNHKIVPNTVGLMREQSSEHGI